MVLHFDEFSRKKLPKVLRFVTKHEKSSIWPTLCNFSSKLPCFGISMKFSAKSYKKCLISWKSTKTHRFCQLATFRENYHVLTFRWTLQQKVAKSCSCREKARKIIDLAKTNNFSSKLPCLGVLVSFSAKSCKKWLISRKRTKNHPFGQNLQLFEETTMFRRFGQLFSKKLQKVAHFDKVHEKSSILPKLATFRGN